MSVEKVIELIKDIRYGIDYCGTGGNRCELISKCNQTLAELNQPSKPEPSEFTKHGRAMLSYSDISDAGKTHLLLAYDEIDRLQARIKDLETQNEILKTDLTSQQINKFMNEWEEFMRVCQPDDSTFCKALRIIYQLQNQLKELEKPQIPEKQPEPIGNAINKPNECKTCNGIGLIHSGEPTMYNCELGGDCSQTPGWTVESCKACGKTVPCPECKPEANRYYLLWQRDCKEMNLAKQKIDQQQVRIKELKTKTIKSLSWMIEDMKHRFNETGIEGNYGPELQEAIELLKELEKQNEH